MTGTFPLKFPLHVRQIQNDIFPKFKINVVIYTTKVLIMLSPENKKIIVLVILFITSRVSKIENILDSVRVSVSVFVRLFALCRLTRWILQLHQGLSYLG